MNDYNKSYLDRGQLRKRLIQRVYSDVKQKQERLTQRSVVKVNLDDSEDKFAEARACSDRLGLYLKESKIRTDETTKQAMQDIEESKNCGRNIKAGLEEASIELRELRKEIGGLLQKLKGN